ncbi:MAG: 16S rRNA (uracil(1498)-N(3))-methyltransferase [Candidatus Nanopelagicales bacterium]
MTAALFLADPGAVAAAQVGSLVELTGAEGRHAVTVQRLGVGEQVTLGDGAGTVLHAVVESLVGRDALSARIRDRVEVPAPQPRLVVVQGLPKGDRGELAVATLTEVGVDVIVPWQAERAIARWTGEKALRGPAKWAATAQAAGKQARRARLPEVASLASGRDVEGLIAAARCAVVLHEDADRPLPSIDLPGVGDLVLIVGPEGGISPAELERFTGAGARAASLGPTVLRTSTAGTVAAAVVLAGTSRWS